MQLDEFAKETILQIAKGVQDANNELKNTESLARVAPMGAYDYLGMPAMRPLTNEKTLILMEWYKIKYAHFGIDYVLCKVDEKQR